MNTWAVDTGNTLYIFSHLLLIPYRWPVTYLAYVFNVNNIKGYDLMEPSEMKDNALHTFQGTCVLQNKERENSFTLM